MHTIKERKKFEGVFEKLPALDEVGQSEYAAIRDVLDQAEDREHALAILDEFAGWAKKLRDRFSSSDKARVAERIVVELTTGNAAFDDFGPDEQVAEILRVLARKFEEGRRPINGDPILDTNGNQVGYISIKDWKEQVAR